MAKEKTLKEFATAQWSRKFAWAILCCLLAFFALMYSKLDGVVWAYFMGGLTLFLFMANVLEKILTSFVEKKYWVGATEIAKVDNAAEKAAAVVDTEKEKTPSVRNLE